MKVVSLLTLPQKVTQKNLFRQVITKKCFGATKILPPFGKTSLFEEAKGFLQLSCIFYNFAIFKLQLFEEGSGKFLQNLQFCIFADPSS